MFDPARRAQRSRLLAQPRDPVDPSHGPMPVRPLGVPPRPLSTVWLWLAGSGAIILVWALVKLWR